MCKGIQTQIQNRQKVYKTLTVYAKTLLISFFLSRFKFPITAISVGKIVRTILRPQTNHQWTCEANLLNF